jgi:hypothetical protein
MEARMKKTYWHDRQERTDAKAAKRLVSIQQALRRLLLSNDTDGMEREHVNELALMDARVAFILGQYEKRKPN